MAPSRHILAATVADLERFADLHGVNRLHGRRVFTAVLARRKPFELIDGIPKRLRDALRNHFDTTLPTLEQVHVSSDGTHKYLLGDGQGMRFETVYIPDVARGRGTHTLCVSSQTGCTLGCAFCHTGTVREAKNLRAEQIVGQVLAVQQDLHTRSPVDATTANPAITGGPPITNVVFMGMGEPLLNYDAVVQAARVLLHHEGLDFSRRRITISTAGVVPRIADLGRDLRTHLAVSLNATTDAVREQIMPINRRWPLAELLAAMRSYPLPRRQRMTVEYVMLDGLNDSLEDARRLSQLLSGMAVKVNLLPLNPHARTDLRPSPPERVERFQRALWAAGMSAIVRTARGQDVAAACGQLGTGDHR